MSPSIHVDSGLIRVFPWHSDWSLVMNIARGVNYWLCPMYWSRFQRSLTEIKQTPCNICIPKTIYDFFGEKNSLLYTLDNSYVHLTGTGDDLFKPKVKVMRVTWMEFSVKSLRYTLLPAWHQHEDTVKVANPIRRLRLRLIIASLVSLS